MFKVLRIDPEVRCVFVSWSSAPTTELLRQLYRELAGCAEFRPDFDSCIDLRGIREFPNPLQMRETSEARTMTETPGGPFSGKRALVASSDIGFGLARMTASVSQVPSAQLQAFRSVEEAAEWLGLPEGYALPFD